ncbi:uncharacterized protein LOC111681539 [Lucilia cuprina]|uniref:uncharacterized protein LOC111681539 n=1 Tax=Lucilia cuprina TaxID=7375 RepID=UPI001F06B37F|nr:uncharacterized protein LOC111681539 [Lucilia cuprina]
MISHLIIISICLYTAAAAVLPTTTTTMDLMENGDVYPLNPSEILPIQPVLIYPTPTAKEKMFYKSRSMLKDNDIIYIKLLKRKSYRPKKLKNQIDEKNAPKEIQMKDIFYVKALANGQFSHNRLKLYRLPEFYAITVYKKGHLKDEGF